MCPFRAWFHKIHTSVAIVFWISEIEPNFPLPRNSCISKKNHFVRLLKGNCLQESKKLDFTTYIEICFLMFLENLKKINFYASNSVNLLRFNCRNRYFGVMWSVNKHSLCLKTFRSCCTN